jgi:hypothetical protein
VYDFYDEALGRYEAALKQWQARHAPPEPQLPSSDDATPR